MALRRIVKNVTSSYVNITQIPVRRQGMLFLSTVDAAKTSEEPADVRKPVAPPSYRHIYPEFLPDPKMEWRNDIREKLERKDMLMRRVEIDIPEFYVGSVLAVTFADKHAQSKSNRFVGICIERAGCGLRASFILRNVIDNQGVEIKFEMYDPKINKVEVLRLEKRLDDHLRYLRDSPPEYSTFPLDMEPEPLPEDAQVPVNKIQVPLKPRPWLERWERQNLQGIQELDLPDKFFKRAEELATPWEKYDLVKEYRKTIPEEDQQEIYAEVYSELHQLEISRRKMKRKKVFTKPKKTG
ncbi:39S ribosomal protein L19, mitochondrial [Ischnura elegans]|uniref:39S ribosomal protein L19, mitochondrial n=1 Tax=Ischnura elegans TaxID=197161 RepID=UPI001ED8989D|nr:39S ribosomal protein L19, mitochondrial [Ischnura elegans]